MNRRQLLVCLTRIQQSELNVMDTTVLLTLECLPDPCFSKDIPITTSKAHLSQTLSKLITLGLIDAIRDRQDNRKKYLIVTQKGKTHIVQLIKE